MILGLHKQVKTNKIKFQRFGDFMTPLSKNDLMNTVQVLELNLASFYLFMYLQIIIN